MANQQLPRREEGVTKLWVRHLDAELGFAFPLVGPGTYTSTGAGVLKRGQAVPNGDEVASLLHAVYCDESTKNWPENQSFRTAMCQNWFWLYQAHNLTPNGVYVRQDPEAKGLALEMDAKTLDSMLKGGTIQNGVRFSKDGMVRFAPKDTYRLVEHTPESLATDGFMIASCGVEGARKMAEVARTFSQKPYVRVFSVSEPTIRLSAVSGSDGGLVILGGYDWGVSDGFAIGVLDVPKAPAQKT